MYWKAIALGPPVEVFCMYASLSTVPLDSNVAELKVNPSPFPESLGVLPLLNLIIPEK
jgi:hypothetical protein